MKYLSWIALFLSLNVSAGYIPFGDHHWQQPVTTFAALPTIGNLVGDIRETLNDFNLYYWSGSAWVNYTTIFSTASGTVTSVGLSDGSSSPIYTISGSPVTTSGTLTFSLSNESANTIFSGPSSGSAAQPSFRAQVLADLPQGATNTVLTGTGASAPAYSANPTISRLTITGAIDAIQLLVQGNSTQNSDLEVWKNFNGTILAAIDNSGNVGIGQDDTSAAQLRVTNTTGTTKAVAQFKGIAAQTGDLTNWLNSTGTILSSINSAGVFTGNGSGLTNVTDPTKVSKAGDTMTGALTINGSADAVQLTIQGNVTQTNNLEQWKNSSGTVLAFIDSLGDMSSGSNTITGNTDTVQLLVKGNSTQTNNLQQWKNFNGTVLASMNSGGNLGAGTIASAAHTITAVVDAVQLLVTGNATQTNDISDWNNSTGTVFVKISGTGALTANKGFSASSGGTLTGAFNINNSTGSAVPVSINGASSQTADLTDWKTNTGTILSAVNSSGSVAIGTATTTAGLTVLPPASGSVVLIAQGLSGQSSDMQDWLSSTGTVLVKIGAAGNMAVGSGSTTATLLVRRGTDQVQMAVQGNTTQTNDLQDWLNNGGTVLAKVNNLGGITTTSASAIKGSVDSVQLTITGNSTQTNDLTDWNNSTGTVLASFQSDGTPAFRVLRITEVADQVGSIIKASAGQGSDLERWQNSTGTTLASVGSGGSPTFTLGSSVAALNFVCYNSSTNAFTFDSSGTCLTSIIKVKENIKDLTDGLREVMAFHPISFDYKKEFNPNGFGRQIGFIAEEIDQIDTRISVRDKKTGQLGGVNYAQMVAILTRAIQEQEAQIMDLQAKITKLNNQR